MRKFLLFFFAVFASGQILPREEAEEMCSAAGLQTREKFGKVYDGFLFFTELDVLHVRLYELDPVVDHFILIETNVTHSNQDKPLLFERHKDKFARYLHKIRRVTPSLPRSDEGHDPSKCAHWDKPCQNQRHWLREGMQRQAILDAVYDAAPEDILLVSDTDEIPSRETVQLLRHCTVPTPVLLKTYFFYYSFNWIWRESNEYFMWRYPQAVTIGELEQLKATPNDMRYFRVEPKFAIQKAGWHLSYFGGENSILRKIRALAHQENNVPEFANIESIRRAIYAGRDLFNRGDPHGRLSPSGIVFEGDSFASEFALPALLREQPLYCVQYMPHFFNLIES